jgi:hypothetical protein
MALLAITVLGFTISGWVLLAAAVIVLIVGVIGWFYGRRTR